MLFDVIKMTKHVWQEGPRHRAQHLLVDAKGVLAPRMAQGQGRRACGRSARRGTRRSSETVAPGRGPTPRLRLPGVSGVESISASSLASLLVGRASCAAQDHNLPDFGTPADAACFGKSAGGAARAQRDAAAAQRRCPDRGPAAHRVHRSLGARLASNANDGDFNFNFFVVDDDAINAFALPGGLYRRQSGLILASENESELAGVLAHEVSHVTQRHIARADVRQPAHRASCRSRRCSPRWCSGQRPTSGNAIRAAGGGQAAAIQSQINFTRDNEYEADRVGMDVLASQRASTRKRWPASSRSSDAATASREQQFPRCSRRTRSRRSASPRRARGRVNCRPRQPRGLRRLRAHQSPAGRAHGADPRGRARPVRRAGRQPGSGRPLRPRPEPHRRRPQR